MRSSEPRNYIVPMTRIRFGTRSERELAYYDNDLVGRIFPVGTVEVTFTPAPEFITPALDEDERARLIEATRAD